MEMHTKNQTKKNLVCADTVLTSPLHDKAFHSDKRFAAVAEGIMSMFALLLPFFPNIVKLFLAVCLVWVTCLRRWVCRLLVGPHVLEVVRSDMKSPQVCVNSRLVQADGWAACGSTAALWCVMCGGCFRHSDVWQDKACFVDLHWTFSGTCLPAWYTSLWKGSYLSQ